MFPFIQLAGRLLIAAPTKISRKHPAKLPLLCAGVIADDPVSHFALGCSRGFLKGKARERAFGAHSRAS